MHAVFMLYGIKQAVEHMLMDMQAQKFQLRCYKEGEPDKSIWIQGMLRILPFGVYDYVFPKESMDLVLTTLDFNVPVVAYNLDKKFLGISPFNLLKDFLGLKNAPEFNAEKKLVWIKENVSIIPIGIKEDGEVTEPEGEYKDFTHERI